MRSTSASCLRALPLLAALAATPALAEPVSADIAQLLQSMQERLSRLEVRNAELEQRLRESAPASAGEAALSDRVEDLEHEVVALSRKPDPMQALDGISVGASLVVVAQKASGGSDANELTARADIEVELPMGSIGDAEGRLFGHLRAGDGDGVDGAVGAFAPTNSMAFGNTPQPVLMQAWYQLDIPVGGGSGNLGQVEVTLGKIDPFGFFDGNNIADDESEQFLNLAFIHNPLLDAGGDIGVGEHGASPGLRLAYVSDLNGGNHITTSLAYFGAGDDGANYTDSFNNGLVIGQVEYAGKTFGGMDGAYRLYAWSNGRAWDYFNALGENVDDGVGNDDGTCDAGEVCDEPTLRERHTGWGLSLDQQVSANASLFARYGHSTRGNLTFDRAYTLGAQFGGAAWGRGSDRIGVAYGLLKTSGTQKLAQGVTGDEHMFEAYYAFQLNDNLSLTPDFQWIRNPAGDETAKDVTVWGLRAKAAF